MVVFSMGLMGGGANGRKKCKGRGLKRVWGGREKGNGKGDGKGSMGGKNEKE